MRFVFHGLAIFGDVGDDACCLDYQSNGLVLCSTL